MTKNANDKRFRQNEQRILNALVKYFRAAKNAITFNVAKFCKKSGIPENTFRDHGGVDGELDRISANVAMEIKTIAKGNMVNKSDAHHLYLAVMQYIKRNTNYFKIYQERLNAELWKITLRELRPALEQIWRKSYGKAKDDIIYTIYRGEIAAIFSCWAESGFPENQFFVALKIIEQLTDGAPARLVRLV